MMHSHDNPPKNRVRDAWMEFIPESFPPAPYLGIYMPARENLELPGYLAKDIYPRQLIGVEHDLDRLPDVITGAGGVRIVAGTPLDAVNLLIRERAPKIPFANVDFEGSYDTYVNQVLALFRIMPPDEDRSADLAVTSFAARNHGLRQGLVHASKFSAGINDLEQFSTQLDMMERRYRIAASMLASADAKPFAHLWRELGYLWWTVVGMGLTDFRPGGYGSLNTEILRERISPGIKRIEAELGAAKRLSFCLVRDAGFVDSLDRRTVRLWPTAMRHILYYSPLRTPMQTWFLKFWQVDPADKRTMRDLLCQVWDLAVRTPLTFIASDGMEVVIGNP